MDNFGFDIIHQLPWSSLLLGVVAVFAGSVIQGATGLGLGMVAAPVLMIIDPVFVPGPLLMLAMLVSFLMAVRERHHIDHKGLALALSGRIPGTILAALTISAIPLALYGLIFGLMVLAAVLLSISRWKFKTSPSNLFTAGLASGYMGTLTSIGAPPIALAYQHDTAAVIRSTLAAFFLVGSAFSILTLVWFGGFSLNHLLVSAVFVPPLLVGFRVSSWMVSRMNSRMVRLSVLGLSGLSALILIIRSVMSLP
tara:strand:+ start:2373 stop:3131 length:759 start_codon:yes stop_codon:yes gene_type:complete